MSRLYDTVEPSVVDRVMLEKAIYDQGPKGEAGTIAKKEDILKIDNLWRFKNLVKLQLDNNIIEQIEGLDHLVQLKWLAAFTKECKAVFQLGLEELKKRQVELNEFWSCVNKTKRASEREGTQKIEEFKVCQQETAKELENNADTIMMEYAIKDYIERVQKLRYDLMHIEMTLVEQLDEVINEFNRNMKDMIDMFLEKVEEHFAECREQQSQFNERLTDISPSVLDRFLRTDSDVVASDDLLSIFGDKESLTNALQASNDAHLLQIDNLADTIIKQAHEWYEKEVKYISEKEGYERNRKRVMEINQVADAFRDYVENMEVMSSIET
ncbi:uncharacterized protein DEA37_0011274 [Paragonimus westermani]|uniref:Uncharacterized protein n=1 Tax=Paragonimus westermani TaxID=34504 RepID=A0A5J4NUK9_9TREM|nr:uncharacterized protein DEA37_0011274 [Paragonimus westermani]